MSEKVISIVIPDIKSTEDILTKLAGALDQKALLDQSAALLLNRIRTRFHAQVGADGVKWKPSHRSIRDNDATLFDTGDLFHSIQLGLGTDEERTIGTDVWYGKHHQFGEGDMYRPFLDFNEDDADAMVRLIQRRVNKALKKNDSDSK